MPFRQEQPHTCRWIYIEVPCLDWILEHRAWFDIYYEHVNYFRMSDFHRMFGDILFSSHTFGGQYISLVADLGTLKKPRVIFALMKSRLGQPIDTVIDINPAKQGRYLPVTGLLIQSPEEALADFPEGGTIHVMNSNYLDEIRNMTGNKYKYVLVDHA